MLESLSPEHISNLICRLSFEWIGTKTLAHTPCRQAKPGHERQCRADQVRAEGGQILTQTAGSVHHKAMEVVAEEAEIKQRVPDSAVAVESGHGVAVDVPVQVRSRRDAERVGLEVSAAAGVGVAVPVLVQARLGVGVLAGQAQRLGDQVDGQAGQLAERLQDGVPGEVAGLVGQLLRRAELVGVEPVETRAGGVGVGDHRQRGVAEPDVLDGTPAPVASASNEPPRSCRKCRVTGRGPGVGLLATFLARVGVRRHLVGRTNEVLQRHHINSTRWLPQSDEKITQDRLQCLSMVWAHFPSLQMGATTAIFVGDNP